MIIPVIEKENTVYKTEDESEIAYFVGTSDRNDREKAVSLLVPYLSNDLKIKIPYDNQNGTCIVSRK